jgi:tetratricopeptide (TPR) repeat protein
VALDSTFVGAWDGLTRAVSRLYANSTPTPELARQAQAAAEHTAALDPDGVERHRALSAYYRTIRGDADRALAEAEAAYRQSPNDATVLASLVSMLRVRGRWEEALQRALAAYAIDPRNANRPAAIATTYVWLRRPAEARPMADRSVALAPRNPSFIQRRVIVSLSEGDLAGARRVLRAATEVPAEEMAAFMSFYWDLGWVLDDAGQRLALSLGPEAFDHDMAQLGIVRAQLYAWRGDTAMSRVWADTAQRHLAAHLRDMPNDAQRHVLRGVALAYMGRYQEAIAEGERGVELGPVSADAMLGPYFVHQLVRIYLRAGQYDKALDRLESIMRIPYYLTPGWLRIDPDFAALRGNPRFDRLAS